MKITDITFDQKFKLYSIQKSLKEFYESGSCMGINHTSGHFVYDFINDQQPIIIETELKKSIWGQAKKIFSEKFKDRQADTYILTEIYKTLLCQHELERLQKLGVTVKLDLGI